jgi:amidase
VGFTRAGPDPRPPDNLRDYDLAVLGPLARSAADLELALGVLAGPGAADAVAWRLRPPPPRAGALPDYRVAVWFDDADTPLDDAVRGPLEDAVRALAAAGASVSTLVAPPIRLAEHERLTQQLVQGELTPTLAVPAFPHDHRPMAERTMVVNGEHRRYWEGLRWTALANVSALPATVAPVGPTAEGPPVGVQVLGPYLEDRTTIALAGPIAELTGGFVPPPGYR